MKSGLEAWNLGIQEFRTLESGIQDSRLRNSGFLASKIPGFQACPTECLYYCMPGLPQPLSE